jgi:NlpC/P60 family putative phage cell wall peptidase
MSKPKIAAPAKAGAYGSAFPGSGEWVPASAGTATNGLRAAVLNEAESWIGTPFHHAARVKGAGVDCLMLLAEVYERAGVSGRIEPPFYVPDWHLHRDAERYMEGLLQYAQPTAAPGPGDIALFRFGRTFSHGAIVTRWPRLIHAYWNIGVVWGDATLHPLKDRPVRFFTPFAV